MTIVEQYPHFCWGAGLAVDLTPDSLLIVGYPHWWSASQTGSYSSFDLLAEWRKAPKTGWSKGRTGKNSPDIEFANADTDEKLIAFVKRFGPVVARFSGELEPDPAFIFAEQDMSELRNERIIYHSALTLLAELGREKKPEIAVVRNCISKIADNIGDWQRPWQREERLRKAKPHNLDPQPNWHFDEQTIHRLKSSELYALSERQRDPLEVQFPGPVQAGHNVICELVNTFQPLVYPCLGKPFEGPQWWDMCYGIRPLLYYILRRRYLESSGIAACANAQCRELFEIERAGQQYCNDVCSRQQRQREYWAKRGKKLRNQRLKQNHGAPTAKKAARRGR